MARCLGKYHDSSQKVGQVIVLVVVPNQELLQFVVALEHAAVRQQSVALLAVEVLHLRQHRTQGWLVYERWRAQALLLDWGYKRSGLGTVRRGLAACRGLGDCLCVQSVNFYLLHLGKECCVRKWSSDEVRNMPELQFAGFAHALQFRALDLRELFGAGGHPALFVFLIELRYSADVEL